ncbi:hypothetical protein OPV22_011604 [Ensete ventricosum]|uniref:Uncharacterized protein n=1 Tax=Ensete ventricosum TaxID=4639 RepID=A0AAV8RIA1_ENSVE|nr:hypothetical protein OPV22_011604 [Ensete ventricosum]
MFEKKPREAELDGLPEWVGKVTNGGEGAVAGGRVVPTGKEEEAGVRLVGEEEEGGSRESCSDRRRVSRGGRRLKVRRLGLVSISSVDFFFPLTPNSSSLLRPEASESGRKAAAGSGGSVSSPSVQLISSSLSHPTPAPCSDRRRVSRGGRRLRGPEARSRLHQFS